MIKKVLIDKANRLYQFPPDLFSFISGDEKPSLIKKTGIIDLGRFQWTIPFPQKQSSEISDLKHASNESITELKNSIADWFYEKEKVRLIPEKEIFIGGRISSILLNIGLAFIDNSDIVFVPETSLPLYRKIVTTAGGEPVNYAISHKTNWSPNFERLASRLGKTSRLLFLNSPHNPTGSELTHKELENIIWIAARENIALVNDAAYQSFSHNKHSSLIGTASGKKVGVEVYSFSYCFGLPQLPFGFVIGNKDIIAGLKQVSRLSQDYIPEFYINMANHAIHNPNNQQIENFKKNIQKTKAASIQLLEILNLDDKSKGSLPFIWAEIPKRKNSNTIATQLYRKYRIISAPGSAFGDAGEGYLRFSLTTDPINYSDAYERIKKKKRLLKTEKEI